jgi:two-component system sensor histidine kinase KdpD
MAIAPAQRPDPDELLAQLQQEQERARRGRLRIYFGAGAGVGKTFAMLGAARREHQAGRDVVVGLVETHGRSETAQLAEGLPRLPLRQVPYRERKLPEFDLDAALERKPGILLVDELAHSNVPGSRHGKRWQDVQELLDAGIDVWSTLNVQHLESLNDTVGAITGIRVHETVPDTVLDAADEVVLVDVTPDELLARLKAGKVYIPQQAERAAQNFFRKGNLIALREIALRRTAEHVEDDVRSYRVEQSIAPVWNTGGAILACVGPRQGAEQTVRAAARLAGQLNVQWYAAYVETPQLLRLPAVERDRILAVLTLAGDLGAATAVLAGNEAAAELVAHAQQLNCAALVVGRPGASRLPPGLRRASMTRRLAALAPTLDIVEIGRRDSVRRLARVVQAPEDGGDGDAGGAPQWPRYAWAAVASVAITLAAMPLRDVLDLANIVMLFLLGTVLVAMRLGRGPAALASCLNVAAFDFFFVPPQLSFAVNDFQYLVTFIVMLAVGLLTGHLTAGLRFQVRIAASRERRAQSLFELTRELSAALLASQVAQLGEAAVRGHFGGDAVVLGTDPRDQLVQPARPLPGFDPSVADWSLRNGQPAGLATSTLAAQPWHYVPLQAPMRVRGVLALRPAQARWLLIPEQRRQLETLARQIAIALERVHYVEIAQQALVEMESERLRNALLAAISHDVRTPLTALIGLAESLAGSQPRLSPAQSETAQALAGQARQLGTLVNNLLEMARLQSGKVSLRLEWQSVEEVVGGALRTLRQLLDGKKVEVHVPPDLPLVEFDATLMERVLVNLVENAAKHGAPPIELRARVSDRELVLTVRDHGPGLPPSVHGREAILFEKFTRGAAESARPGVGLGLAICKAVVDAHRGTISAANADGGGAEFTVRLPRRPPPEIPAALAS